MEDKKIIKKYSNGEVTIVWEPLICIHSTICWKGENSLPEVFKPKERPWIKPDGASTERIIEQVNKCPSGALSYFLVNEQLKKETIKTETIIEVKTDGPLLVYGNIVLKNNDRSEVLIKRVTAFCRCGASKNNPYCDGSHRKAGFKG